jgi:CelD/BcsL family acetyltransferase involved in cellulose biosynthesis
VLDAFREQKATRFAKQGIHNVFEDPGVTDFIRAACLDGLAERGPVIELHALEGAGEVLAVVGGVSDRHRFSVMFNSITASDYARMSPGIILMDHIINDCAKRGLTSFDLGAGHAPYKDYFCSTTEQCFDCFIPATPRGRALGAAYRTSRALKRSLKANPALMNALQAVRRWTTASAA